MFINRYDRSNIVEDRNNFLTRIEDFKPYIVDFEKNSAIKPKIYLSDYEVGGNDRRPIIINTQDDCTFSANDGI